MNYSASEAGKALKIILARIESMDSNEINNDTSQEYGCLYCSHYLRKEGYNQQWGMYQFYNCYCNKGIEKRYYPPIIDESKCNEFEHGDNILIYMSEKEKEEINKSYYI